MRSAARERTAEERFDVDAVSSAGLLQTMFLKAIDLNMDKSLS